MKKIIIILVVLYFLTGCTNLMNTPTKKTEEFFNKYQTLNTSILNQLDYTLDESYSLTKKQMEEYKSIMKRQYKNLLYTIKEELVDGNTAIVTTEIEVYDYVKALQNANNHLINNQDEFIEKDGQTNKEKFMDYKINQLKKESSRIKYTLELNLIKKNDEWYLEDITELDRQKIHGLYS